MLVMSILHHPHWWDLRPYVRLQTHYGPEGPYRLEVDTPDSGILLRRFLALQMACVCCGQPISPVRVRAGYGTMYLTGTCGQDINLVCSRSVDAREEHDAVVIAILGYTAEQASKQLQLFPDP